MRLRPALAALGGTLVLAASALAAVPVSAAGSGPAYARAAVGTGASTHSLLAGHALVAGTDHDTLSNGWYTLSTWSARVEIDESIPLPGSGQVSGTSTGTWMRQDPTGRVQPAHDHTRLRLTSHGDLVLVTSWGRRLWHSGTRGSGAVRLTLHDGGELALHTRSGRIVWRSHSGQVQMSGGMTLGPGRRLRDAWETAFAHGRPVTLTMQRDGNLVHRCGSKVDWQTHTHVRGSTLRMFRNGALRVLTPKGRVVWGSGSGGHDYAWLNAKYMWVQADGIDLVWSAPLNYDAC